MMLQLQLQQQKFVRDSIYTKIRIQADEESIERMQKNLNLTRRRMDLDTPSLCGAIEIIHSASCQVQVICIRSMDSSSPECELTCKSSPGQIFVSEVPVESGFFILFRGNLIFFFGNKAL